MSSIEILLIGIGLSMDAFAVSVCKGLSVKKLSIKNGSLTVVSNFSLTKSLKTLIISMLLSFFIVKFVKINVLIWANMCYNRHRR